MSRSKTAFFKFCGGCFCEGKEQQPLVSILFFWANNLVIFCLVLREGVATARQTNSPPFPSIVVVGQTQLDYNDVQYI